VLPEQSPYPTTGHLAHEAASDALADPSLLDCAHVTHQASQQVQDPSCRRHDPPRSRRSEKNAGGSSSAVAAAFCKRPIEAVEASGLRALRGGRRRNALEPWIAAIRDIARYSRRVPTTSGDPSPGSVRGVAVGGGLPSSRRLLARPEPVAAMTGPQGGCPVGSRRSLFENVHMLPASPLDPRTTFLMRTPSRVAYLRKERARIEGSSLSSHRQFTNALPLTRASNCSGHRSTNRSTPRSCRVRTSPGATETVVRSGGGHHPRRSSNRSTRSCCGRGTLGTPAAH
jgi:hypothetical protein